MTAMPGLRASSIYILLAMLTACGGGGGGGGGSAGLIALPKTGQTTCSDAAGTPIVCAGTGQDGALQIGVAGPSARFTVDFTGACITDNLTGLMWTRDANLLLGATGGTDTGARTWQQALDYADGIYACGFADWRLANHKELRSLVNYGLANNADTLNNLGFYNVQANYYWSSSSSAGSAANAWAVYMDDGDVDTDSKSIGYYVWPVRDAQPVRAR